MLPLMCQQLNRTAHWPLYICSPATAPAATAGALFISYTIKTFGALLFATIMTTRQVRGNEDRMCSNVMCLGSHMQLVCVLMGHAWRQGDIVVLWQGGSVVCAVLKSEPRQSSQELRCCQCTFPSVTCRWFGSAMGDRRCASCVHGILPPPPMCS